MNPSPLSSKTARRSAVLLASCVLLIGAGLTAGAARAADDAYPNHTVKINVGYAPGGTTDIMARLIAPGMAESLGQTVIVENRPGAGGNLASDLTANAAPDGYTLMMGTAGSMTVNPWIYNTMKSDTVKDFTPISMVSAVSNVMVVPAALPVRTVAEFVAWAKARPGKVFFASSGIGNTPHLTGEMFNLRTGLKLIHVPYKGSGPALADLVGGQGVQVMFDNLPSAIGHVRSGALRALAVTGPERSQSLPDVPTMEQAGYKDFVVQGWFGMFAPARTPAPIIAKVHTAILAALAKPDVRKRFEDLGATLVGNDPGAFAKTVETERANWGEIVKAAGIKPN
ncbi:MAG: tripartite tricarboxylate transporter substrate binding protein [Pseudomonadota bacterium]|nr:tripartite tricarboxylate transporter substrate binding protein [Pseudomonadota bacterium]